MVTCYGSPRKLICFLNKQNLTTRNYSCAYMLHDNWRIDLLLKQNLVCVMAWMLASPQNSHVEIITSLKVMVLGGGAVRRQLGHFVIFFFFFLTRRECLFCKGSQTGERGLGHHGQHSATEGYCRLPPVSSLVWCKEEGNWQGPRKWCPLPRPPWSGGGGKGAGEQSGVMGWPSLGPLPEGPAPPGLSIPAPCEWD